MLRSASAERGKIEEYRLSTKTKSSSVVNCIFEGTMIAVMDSRPSPTKTRSGSFAWVSKTQVLSVAASPAMVSGTSVMESKSLGDSVAAFWLTMTAAPEGAQGQVTFQLLLMEEASFPAVGPVPSSLEGTALPPPHPARSPTIMAHASVIPSIRFFISFSCKIHASGCRALHSAGVCTISWTF